MLSGEDLFYTLIYFMLLKMTASTYFMVKPDIMYSLPPS